jgi:hypothetical protein
MSQQESLVAFANRIAEQAKEIEKLKNALWSATWRFGLEWGKVTKKSNQADFDSFLADPDLKYGEGLD